MALRLESRPVGDVLVVQCHGRIVAGNDVYALHAHVGDSLSHHAEVVLQLDEVGFVDSSGLGALVRLLQAARSKGGDLKLSGVPEMLRRSMQMSNLISQFELYDSVDEAITAAYLGSRYSRGMAGDARPRVLCLYESSDVRAFVREVLIGAGYNAMTVANIDDAKILLKATKTKLVLVSAQLQSCYGRSTSKVLQEVDPTTTLVVLDENFSMLEPGDAARKLLSSVGAK